jgi:hypothetical protein
MGGDLLRRKILSLRQCLFFAALLCAVLPAWAEIAVKEDPVPAPPLRSQRRILQGRAPERFSGQARSPDKAGHRAAIAGLDQDLTRRYLRQYSGNAGLAYLADAMERGGPYLAFIGGRWRSGACPGNWSTCR